MRAAARLSALSVSGAHFALAAAISAAVTRSLAAVSSSLSSRCVCSITAASPRVRTSSTIAVAAASTSAANSRFRSSSAAKSLAKPRATLSSLSGTGGLAKTLDPRIDFGVARLERDAVNDETRGHVGDVLDLDQAVLAQRLAGGDEIDDAPRQTHAGRQLHRAVELDAFGLDAAACEVPARDLGIFGGDAHCAPARRIVVAEILRRRGDDKAALADAEIERRVDLGVLEFHQYIAAGDTHVRTTEGDERGNVEIAHANDVEVAVVGAKAQLARVRVIELTFDFDSGAPHNRHDLVEDAPFGQCQHQRFVTEQRSLQRQWRQKRTNAALTRVLIRMARAETRWPRLAEVI